MTEQIQNLKKFRFIPEITLGNVLQLLSIAAAVIGLWVNMDKRISAVELRESYSIEERRDFSLCSYSFGCHENGHTGSIVAGTFPVCE